MAAIQPVQVTVEHPANVITALASVQAECSIEGCGRKVLARGWCQKHYSRWWKYGDPATDRTFRTHGQHNTPLYHCWEAMKQRAGNRDGHHPTYSDVSIDARWLTFQGFLDNQPSGRQYEPGLCLARGGDIGNYTPENTEWLERAENARRQHAYRQAAS